MSWFSRLMGVAARPLTTTTTTTTTTTAATSTTTPKPATPTGPLQPAFSRESAKFGAQVNRAIAASRELGDGFYACKMEVGAANVKGAPTFYGYGTHKPMTMSIDKQLPDDRLDLVVCLNVSGHDFKDANKKLLPNAQELMAARAKTNTYVVQVTHPDGSVQRMTGIEAKGATSTAQEISIRGMKPGKTIVEAWPEGSAGVAGYVEGRRLEISYLAGTSADRFG